MEDTSYKAESILVLGGLEGIRKRPAMYIGSVGIEGLHHLVYEVVDNSIDEAMVGFCTFIEVSINLDGSVTVMDNGRGIPVDIHPKFNKPAVEVILTTLHSGGKFDKKAYKVSGGLHGVGLSVVNALSKRLVVEVFREGKIHKQTYEYGKPATSLEIIGEATETGTRVTFWPDETTFPITEFHYDILAARLRELAFLNKKLKIVLKDLRQNKEGIFQYEGGVISFVEYLNENKVPLHKPLYFEKEKDGLHLEIAMAYNSSYQELVYSFVNNINTREGGTHLIGFKAALTKTLNKFAEQYDKEMKLSSDDVREGLIAVVAVKIPEPQ
ncbi:hypothetical protein HYS48_02195, partial [Candidatus Woesearchaeota archaeon]|nr:hypothetical protein [Candidatus Woesearchaeota archaeon]